MVRRFPRFSNRINAFLRFYWFDGITEILLGAQSFSINLAHHFYASCPSRLPNADKSWHGTPVLLLPSTQQLSTSHVGHNRPGLSICLMPNLLSECGTAPHLKRRVTQRCWPEAEARESPVDAGLHEGRIRRVDRCGRLNGFSLSDSRVSSRTPASPFVRVQSRRS
jgi:hypothetical protein